MRKERLNHLLFELGARGYDLLTSQELWSEQIEQLARLVEPELEGLSTIRALDIGCGPGQSTFALARYFGDRAEIVGVDLAPSMIERARGRHVAEHPELANISFACADATRLPFAAGAFDLITGHSFLYLVADPLAVMHELRRLLSPTGVAGFLDPSDGSLLASMGPASRHTGDLLRRPLSTLRFVSSMLTWRLASAMAGRMSERRLRRLLLEAGFARVSCTTTLGGLGLHSVARSD